MPKAEGKSFKFDGEEVIDPKLLETFPFKDPQQIIEIVTNEFSAVCPFSGLPDIATVILQYIPFNAAIELKSLKYYFTSYRNAGVYQERATQLIHQHLVEALKTDVYVETRYNTRGGIDVVCRQGGIKIAITGGKNV